MLTALVATRDGASTLPRVLDAYTALRSPPGGWKLVLVDNGSRDATGAIARAYAARLPLELLTEPRPGKNRALNRGLAALDGDLAVFSDDDTLPEPDWLLRLRAAADAQPGFDVFGGRILPHWDAEPEAWVREWVLPAPVFGLHDPPPAEGPCEPTRVWGPNMAVRAVWFRRGYRFDERLGPDGSPRYAMGSETELTLRLALAEGAACWHCAGARVRHIIQARQMTRPFVLRRAFNLGRCVRREARQRALFGQPHAARDAAAIAAGLARGLTQLAAARRRGDARGVFEARWQLNLWTGCLYEALRSRYTPRPPIRDAGLPA